MLLSIFVLIYDRINPLSIHWIVVDHRFFHWLARFFFSQTPDYCIKRKIIFSLKESNINEIMNHVMCLWEIFNHSSYFAHYNLYSPFSNKNVSFIMIKVFSLFFNAQGLNPYHICYYKEYIISLYGSFPILKNWVKMYIREVGTKTTNPNPIHDIK